MEELLAYYKRKLGISDEQFNQLVEVEKDRIANPNYDYNNLSLDEAKNLKKQEMNSACEKAIVGGFTSSNNHVYRTNRDDQTNMIGQYNALVADSSIANVQWKTEDVGYVTITRDEWLTVYQEAFTHKQTQLFKYNQLKGKIYACTTTDEVTAIVW